MKGLLGPTAAFLKPAACIEGTEHGLKNMVDVATKAQQALGQSRL